MDLTKNNMQMKSSYFYKKWGIRFAFILAIIIVLVIKAHYGIHQDEILLASQGYEIINAGGLLGRDWCTFQFSGIYHLPFIYLREALFPDAGILLYFRICFIFIQTGVCAAFYFLLRKHFDENKVFIATMIFAMTYKNFHTFYYLTYYFWFCILTIAMLVKYWYSTKQSSEVLFSVLMAVFSAAAVIGYQGCVVMPIACIICICAKTGVGIKRKILYSLLQIGICAGIGIALLATSLATFPMEDVLEGLKQVFYLEEHDESPAIKLLKNGSLYVGIFIITSLLYLLYKKVIESRKANKITLDIYLSIIMIVVAVAGCLVRTESINPNRFFYPVLAVSFLTWFFVRKKGGLDRMEANGYTYCFLIPSLFMVVSIMIASNTELGGSIFGFIPSVVALILISDYIKFKIVTIVTIVFMAIGLFFVLDIGGNIGPMWAERELMEEGPTKGLLLSQELKTKEILTNQQKVMEENISKDDKYLMYCSSNYFTNGYLFKYDVEGGTGFLGIHLYEGKRDLEFYNLYEDKIPTVIIYDETYFGDVKVWERDSEFGRYVNKNYHIVKTYDDYGYVVFRHN